MASKGNNKGAHMLYFLFNAVDLFASVALFGGIFVVLPALVIISVRDQA